MREFYRVIGLAVVIIGINSIDVHASEKAEALNTIKPAIIPLAFSHDQLLIWLRAVIKNPENVVTKQGAEKLFRVKFEAFKKDSGPGIKWDGAYLSSIGDGKKSFTVSGGNWIHTANPSISGYEFLFEWQHNSGSNTPIDPEAIDCITPDTFRVLLQNSTWHFYSSEKSPTLESFTLESMYDRYVHVDPERLQINGKAVIITNKSFRVEFNTKSNCMLSFRIDMSSAN